MPEKIFTITVNVRELMTAFVPKLARQYMDTRGPDATLQGTLLTLSVDVSGDIYSYTITDGMTMAVTEGTLDNPMVFLTLPVETMALLARMEYIDMVLGGQRQLRREKHDVLSGVSGTVVFRLHTPEDQTAEISATFNGARTPLVTIGMPLDDAREVTAGRVSPVQLFMSGKLTLEGDLAFAMSLQNLFV